jgi:SAM-dependent methyltransferase
VLKILVVIASYGFANDHHLRRVLKEYRSMPYDINIKVLSDVERQLESDVDVVVVSPCRTPQALPFEHKKLLERHARDFDLFIYTEDDILITETNIKAFVTVSQKVSRTEIPGFIRFESNQNGRLYYPDIHRTYRWNITSIRASGEYTIACFTNDHSGCYMLTRDQLVRAIESGKFMAGARRTQYGMLETAATDIYTQCGLRKVIAISHVDEYLVHHLPNKYIGQMGVDDDYFRDQIEVMLSVARDGHIPRPLIQASNNPEPVRFGKDCYESERRDLIRLIPEHAKNVLSVGCGWGLTETRLSEDGHSVIALPIDAVVSAGLAKNKVNVINGDIASIASALNGKRVDCILISGILQLVEDPIRLLSSLRELLNSDGVLIATVPKRTRLLKWWSSFRSWQWESSGGYAKTGVQLTSRFGVKKWLRRSGLRPTYVTEIVQPTQKLRWQTAIRISRPLRRSEIIAAARNT